MKRIALLLLMLTVLCSCSADKASSDESTFRHPAAEVVITQQDAGKIVTLLDEAAKITDCEFLANPTAYKINPPICSNGDTLYIYKYPPFTAVAGMAKEDAAAYLQNYTAETTEYTYEIEVCTDGQVQEIIPLNGLGGGRILFDQIFLDKAENALTLFGRDMSEEEPILCRYRFSMDGSLLDRMPLTGVPLLADCWPLGDSVYFLDPDAGSIVMQNMAYTVFRYDTATGEISNPDFPRAIAMFESRGVLYCLGLPYDSEKITLYEIGTDGLLAKEAFDPVISAVNAVEYDAENRVLYYSNLEQVCTLHLDDCIPRTILFTGDRNVYIEGITDSFLLIRNGNYAVTAYDLPTEKLSLDENQQVLRVYSMESSWSNAHSDELCRMMNLNDYSVQTKAQTIESVEEYRNTMAKKLLAGDTDFDIFYVDTEMSDLLRGQYYEDLSQYPILRTYYSRMISGVEDLCTVDGVCALVPKYLTTDCMEVNTAVSGYNPDIIRTWSDVLSAADSITLAPGTCIMKATRGYNLVRSSFKLLISNFMHDVISDEQAREDLDLLYRLAVELPDDPRFCVDSDEKAASFLYETQNRGVFASASEDRVPIPLLTPSDGYAQVWNGTFYAINPNSKNKELAAAYLAYFIEDSLTRPATGALYAVNDTEPVQNPDAFDLFCEQLSDGILAYEIPDFTGYFNNQFKGIEAGRLSIEDAAEELWRKMKMIKYE